MIIDCIADLHGFYPELEGGDLLIVAGDLTARDFENEVALFDYWLNEQNYKHKIVVAGNHDNVLQEGLLRLQFGIYLCDSGTTLYYDDGPCAHPTKQPFKKLKIWGSPWTLRFPGMNPKCTAFTVDTEEELAKKWALIPEDTDILVTHGPPYGILDEVENPFDRQIENVGSMSLLKALSKINPTFHIFGHIHEGYGKAGKKSHQVVMNQFSGTALINASHVNERYEPVNKPIRIIL